MLMDHLRHENVSKGLVASLFLITINYLILVLIYSGMEYLVNCLFCHIEVECKLTLEIQLSRVSILFNYGNYIKQ
jgi:hypothetical protein